MRYAGFQYVFVVVCFFLISARKDWIDMKESYEMVSPEHRVGTFQKRIYYIAYQSSAFFFC